jgi:NADH-quinone oxidoreductase subunit N
VAAAAATTGDAAERGLQAALLYLLVYAFMTIGAFTVVMIVARSSHDARHSITEYRSLATERPLIAGFLAFFLLAQAGVPLTGGFVAKLEVFAAATDAHEYYLVIVGVLAAVVAAFMYLRIVVTMFDTEGEEDAPRRVRARIDPAVGAALVITAGFTLAIGIAPGWFLHLAKDATLATLLF